MKIIKLKTPITITSDNNTNTITELKIPDELTAGDILAGEEQKHDLAKMLAIVSSATGEPMAVLKRLSLSDLKVVNEAMEEQLKKL